MAEEATTTLEAPTDGTGTSTEASTTDPVGTTEQAGQNGTVGDLPSARSFDDILGADDFSDSDLSELRERSSSFGKFLDGQIDRARSNAERRTESKIRRLASTTQGQETMFRSALQSAGFDAAAQQKALGRMGNVAETIRNALARDTFQEVMDEFVDAGVNLTEDEIRRLDEATTIEYDASGEAVYKQDSQSRIQVYAQAMGRARALEMDPATLIKDNPESPLARGVARMIRESTGKELQAQGVAAVGNNNGSPPNTPTGGTQGSALERYNALSEADKLNPENAEMLRALRAEVTAEMYQSN